MSTEQIEQERINAFQGRMSSWVSKQGLIFQVRYAAAIQGAESTVIGTIVRLLSRLLVLLLVTALVAWIYLSNRANYEWFQQDLGESISHALGAESAVVTAVDRKRGHLEVQRVSLEGGEDSFFYDAEIRGLRTRMSFLDGLTGKWGGDLVMMGSLDLALKSGADSDEEASQAFQSFFNDLEEFEFQSIEVKSATIHWGYTEMHRGSIEGAYLKARRRSEGGWQLVFSGGTFSQNWLKRFTIERIEVTVTEESVEFVEVNLGKEGGSIVMTGRLTKGGARPEFEGSGIMRALPVWAVIDAEYREFMEGEISGEINLHGSTNSQEGIAMEVAVKLEEGDHVVLRDRFPLFRAVSAIDRLRSYKKVRFTSGKFGMKTGGDQLELSDVWLQAQGLMQVEGDLLVRRPTVEEVDEKLNPEKRPTVAEGDDEEVKEDDVTLKDAVEAENTARERSVDAVLNRIYQDASDGGAHTKIANAAVEREKSSYYMTGQMRIGVTADVFDASPDLDAAYPLDDKSGFRWLDVSIKGRIFNIGEALAEDLYLKSRRSSR